MEWLDHATLVSVLHQWLQGPLKAYKTLLHVFHFLFLSTVKKKAEIKTQTWPEEEGE